VSVFRSQELLAACVLNMEKVLITSYINPDMDGTACAIAYAEFLNQTGTPAVAGLLGSPHEEAQYVTDRFGITLPLIVDADNFDKVVLVDVSELFLLNGKVAADKVIEIIDHRLIGQLDDFKNAKKQIELVGSAATLVAERFLQNQIAMSRNSAILLLSAIVSNTLNFKGSVTTQRDKNVADELFKISELPRDYFRELFAAKSDLTGEKLKAALLAEITSTRIIAGKRMVMPQLEIIGAEKLIADRLSEIISILQEIKNQDQLDFIFLNLVDLENGRNYFVASDDNTKNLIEHMFGLHFVGDYVVRDGLILRKQIWPMIKSQLEMV